MPSFTTDNSTNSTKRKTMKEEIAKKQKKQKGHLYRNFIELVAVGSVTGIFAGVVVSLFKILVYEGEEISRGVYAYVRAHPAFIPLLLLALALGAFFIGVAVNLSSVVRGCGIPQAEGAARGIVPLKWWKDMTLMFATSLASVFMGLSIGAEGPSVLIGACSGDGVSTLLKRDQMIRRYQITGGACAGLAVASNAPLTGMAFAFEEAHKRFTPEVFICAFSSVIFAVLVRTGIYSLLGLEVTNLYGNYLFYEIPMANYWYVIVAGIVCGVCGVGFYKLCIQMRKWFRKISIKNPKVSHGVRIAFAVFLGGIVSFTAAGVMGGGESLIHSLGTMGGTVEPTAQSSFGETLFWTLLIILCLKFLITTINVGAGIPCGIFVPVIAIGACLGALMNQGWVSLGMDEKYCDIMIMICMAAFFTTIVKAPITAIIMICEFTGSFAPLLPVIIAVSIGYLIGEISKTGAIYDELLEMYEHETGIHAHSVKEVYTLSVERGSLADKREVRDILWPAGTRVKELHRGEEVILPDGKTVLHGGDLLTIVCLTSEPSKTKDELEHILS